MDNNGHVQCQVSTTMAIDKFIVMKDQHQSLNNPKVTCLYWHTILLCGNGIEMYQLDDTNFIH